MKKIVAFIFFISLSIEARCDPWIFWRDLKDGTGKYYRTEKFFKSGTSDSVFFQDTLLNFEQKQKILIDGKLQLAQSIVFLDEISCSDRSITRSSGTAFSGTMGTGYELGRVFIQKDQTRYVFAESDWEIQGFKKRFCKSFLDFLK
jgi:hypothetical protein